MGTIGSGVVTLIDIAKRLDPNGKIPAIVEMLSQSNPILLDMLWREGNLTLGHRVTVRTGLPTVYWRMMNQGVPPSKSTTAQVDESVGMLEAWSETDEELVNLENNKEAFRLSEAVSFIEAMSQEMSSTLFYGNSSLAPEEITGFSPRYSDLSANNGRNIVDGGGTGSDNSSIWLVGWGDNSVFGIYPKGSKAGLEHNDLGVETVEVTAGIAGNRMRAYRDQWKWKTGLVLKDWRKVARIANIDISNLVAESAAANITKLMVKATHRIQNIESGSYVFYMNKSVFQYLDLQRIDSVTSGGGITFENVDGKMTYMFRGIPIRICDTLLETEARVT